MSEQARVDLMDAIRHKITHHPRSLQKRIGPSEIGNPCDRRIGYKLLGQPENPRGDAWKPTIGTAVHAWLEEALDDDDARLLAANDYTLGDHDLSWLTEKKVVVGYPVEHVAINFLPQAGNLTDAHWWSEPFDFAIAAQAIARLRAIEAHITTSGSVEGLQATEAWCAWCPFHLPGTTDLQAGCPGLQPARSGSGFAHMVEAPNTIPVRN